TLAVLPGGATGVVNNRGISVIGFHISECPNFVLHQVTLSTGEWRGRKEGVTVNKLGPASNGQNGTAGESGSAGGNGTGGADGKGNGPSPCGAGGDGGAGGGGTPKCKFF